MIRYSFAFILFALIAAKTACADPIPFKADVAYGPHELQKIDIYKPEGKGPFPFVMDIHGGGWWNGDKKLSDSHVKRYTDAGIAVVGVNYRMLHAAHREGVYPPVQACLDDIKYALQFVRNHAKEWDLDKNAVGLTGVSAGGFSALWLGLSDDMADPEATDPVLRESTRVLVIGVRDAQTSIDPIQMRDWVGPELKYGGHAFGMNEKDFEGFLAKRSKFEKYFPNMSPAELISSDDPAIFMNYKFSPNEKKKGGNFYVHSPNFGTEFKKLADSKGVECYVQHPDHDVHEYVDQYDFVLEKLIENKR